jgi:two-component system C4-dicarboxylate transport response regulator DctD
MEARTRILLVDDDDEAREMLGEFLTDEGFAVQMASDAVTALNKLSAFPADVVVTDLEMPGMSGLELIRAVHARDPGWPTLLITGREEGAAIREVEAQPAAACLHKPLDLDELRAIVERLVQARDATWRASWATAP